MPIQDRLPKSRITLVYRTNISGQEEEVNLPFRMLVLGDFSLGTSTDRKLDLDERKLRSVTASNLSDLMKDMDMSIEFDVEDKIGGNAQDGGGRLPVKLPINKMKSFHPDEIVNHVPKLKALLLMRKLLLEMQADIDNRKAVRQKLHDLYANQEDLKKILASDQLKNFDSLKLPSGEPAPVPVPAPVPG